MKKIKEFITVLHDGNTIDYTSSLFTTIANNRRAAAVVKKLAAEGRYICSIYAYGTNYIFYYRKNNEGR